MADAKLAGQIVRMRQRRTGPLILELDLSDGIVDGPPQDPVAALLTIRRTRLPDLLDGLKRAASDDRVHALVVKVGGSRIGLAKLQELRDAVLEFRQSGKLAVAWSESFCDFVRGNVPYYLATGFDRIYLQPSGTLGLTGVAVEQVFLHGALERLGVDFQSAARYEYKSAADQLTETGFTGPAREAAARLAESVTEQLAAAVASGRGLTVEHARTLLARGPFLAPQALSERLVDGLLYRDQVYEQVRTEAGADATLLYLQRYQRTHSLSDLPRRLGSGGREQRPGRPGRRRVGLGHGGGRAAGGGGRRGRARRGAAGEQPRRLRHRVRRHLARGGPGPRGGQARRRVDGRRGRVRRVLHLRAGRRDRDPAGHDHRVDRGDPRQAGPARAVRAGRRVDRLGGGRRRQRDDLLRGPAVLRRGLVADQRLARRRLRGFHGKGGVRAADGHRAGARACPRPRLDRRRRGRQRPRRRDRRDAGGDRDLPPPGRAAGRRAGPVVPPVRRARPAPAGRIERVPAGRRRLARGGGGRFPVRRRLGSRLAVRGGGGPAAVRPARPARGMENQLISNGPAMTAPGNDFSSALTAWAAGVTLVTIADSDDDIGTTVSAFMPVSFDPPMVVVSLIAGSYPAEVLSRPSLPAAQFAVTLLAADQKLLAGQFAAAGRPSARRILDDAPHTRGAQSGALIPLGGLAALECSVARRVPAGDHLLVISAVTSVAYVAEAGDPLIRFRGRYPSP